MFAAAAQGGGQQEMALSTLRNNRNQEYIGECNVTGASTVLTCDLVSQDLFVNGSVYVQGLDVQLWTCDSAVGLIFRLSNGTDTINITEYVQCSTAISVGELHFFLSANVSSGPSFTVVRIVVSLY